MVTGVKRSRVFFIPQFVEVDKAEDKLATTDSSPVKLFKLDSQVEPPFEGEEIVLDIVVGDTAEETPIVQVKQSHTCDKCAKVFKSKRSLQGHVREMHSGKSEKFHCPECEFPFTRRTNLRAHIADYHRNVVFGPESPGKDSDLAPAPGPLGGGRQRKAPKVFDL